MTRKTALIALLPLLLLLPMCSGSDDGSDSPAGPSGSRQAKLRVLLTDKPTEELSAVWVTIAAVRVHQSAGAEDGEGGWIELPVTAAAMPVDLLTLQNGVLLPLCGPTPLPAGNYQQVRLVLTPNTGTAAPFNNYVTSTAGDVPIDVPSGTIKILHLLSTVEGQTTELTLDFDASQSVKQRGNGTYFMQPVIKATNGTAAG